VGITDQTSGRNITVVSVRAGLELVSWRLKLKLWQLKLDTTSENIESLNHSSISWLAKLLPVVYFDEFVPLRAVTQINAGQSLASTNRGLDQNEWILFRIRSVQRRRPRSSDRHGFVLSAKSDEELNGSRWMDEIFAI